MSGRNFHNMLNKHCYQNSLPYSHFFFYKKEENVKYTTKDRPLVGCSIYSNIKPSEIDLFAENAPCRLAIHKTDYAWNILLQTTAFFVKKSLHVLLVNYEIKCNCLAFKVPFFPQSA